MTKDPMMMEYSNLTLTVIYYENLIICKEI